MSEINSDEFRRFLREVLKVDKDTLLLTPLHQYKTKANVNSFKKWQSKNAPTPAKPKKSVNPKDIPLPKDKDSNILVVWEQFKKVRGETKKLEEELAKLQQLQNTVSDMGTYETELVVSFKKEFISRITAWQSTLSRLLEITTEHLNRRNDFINKLPSIRTDKINEYIQRCMDSVETLQVLKGEIEKLQQQVLNRLQELQS